MTPFRFGEAVQSVECPRGLVVKSRPMSLAKPIVFFIHGLNTFGDDQFHIGPLVLGPMHQHWKPRLEAAGFEFHSLDEMGFGAFDDQVDRAVRKIIRAIDARAKAEIHLFGHSMGGLVARGVGAKLAAAGFSVKSIITLGTPHQGTTATEGAFDLSKNSPRLYRTLKWFGYDLEMRREALVHFTMDRVRAYTDRHPVLEGVDCVSLVGACRREQLGLAFQLIYAKLHKNGEPSDGLIAADSQEWARVGGVFQLDHAAELGLFTQVMPSARKASAREFERLAATVVTIIRGATVEAAGGVAAAPAPVSE